MRGLTWLALWLAVACGVLVPSAVFAQASISGVARDAQGGVLPGVTVEASSPALIERTRVVATDGSGQYLIVDLRPGTYAVTFTLAGFSTVKREGIALSGSFVATVNAEMKVGAIEETITVTGEAPTIDIRSVSQQRVLDAQVIDAIPTGRTHFAVGALVPSVITNNRSDVGGTNAIDHVFLTAHGGRTTDQRVMLDGLSTNNAEGSSQFSGYLINMGSSQEVTMDVAAGSAEQATGGVRLNVIPRDGGNTFRGSFFATGTNEHFAGTNLTGDLKARGLTTATSLRKLWDVNPSFGGPIVRDRIWFYSAGRVNGEDTYSGGFFNKNEGTPSWVYVPDTDRPAYNHANQTSINARMTWQANTTNKFSFFYDKQTRCWCQRRLTPTTSPEGISANKYPQADLVQGTWSSPTTNRLLLDAGISYRPERWKYLLPYRNLIGVTEQSTGMVYRGATNANGGGLGPDALNLVVNSRAAATYVTGSHALKAGINNQWGKRELKVGDNDYNLTYRFNNGIPNQITQRSTPFTTTSYMSPDLGVYIQDKWTIDRLTMNVGLRFDYYHDSFPEQQLGPSQYTPDRNVTFPKTDWVSWKDLTPRLGAAYDLFGDGKTAVKISLNKYMLSLGLQGLFGDGMNPINLTANQVTRSWNDSFYPVGDPRRGNYVPDCDLTSTAANAECGAMSNANFGLPVTSAAIDPDILRGWGKRGYNWEFSTSVQRQLARRLSVDVGYFRRWYGNFIAIDNLATTAADYTAFSITAPQDSRLSDGGGYVVSGLYDINPSKVGQVNNFFTFADNYGKTIEHWNGIDLGVNLRPSRAVMLQAGVSTGRTVTDNCAVTSKAPEAIWGNNAVGQSGSVTLATTPTSGPYCHANTGFLTQVKGFGAYTVPKINVQTSASFSSTPGAPLAANYTATNAVIAPSLGRNLSAGAANATVNLVAPGQMYGDVLNNLDVRIAKMFGSARKTSINVDIFNVTNANPVLTENSSYAVWRTPQSILQPRFAKFSVQFDF